MAARRQALQIAARAVQERINADTSDHQGPKRRCACGQMACYAGRCNKSFDSALGVLTLGRAYYHCASCKAGFFPRDRELGLEGTSLSPALTRMIGAVGAMVSFEEGHQLIEELAGIHVTAKQVERGAEALGAEIALDERLHAEPIDHDGPLPSTLYLGLDGTGIPMRASELTGRAGKQPDGSAKTREVKLCVVWSAEKCDNQGIPVRDEGSVTYSAAIESAARRDTDETPSDFAARVVREMLRRQFSKVTRRVVLGDGAPWIWNLASEHAPDAIQIVDLFHAKEHLSNVGKSIYGAASDLAKAWAKERHAQLDEGPFDDLLAAVRTHANANEDARKCVAYLEENRHRMRYPEFRAAGLCVSTGVVEAGCKVAIGTRLKRTGMHWTLCGANAIIALRCARLSGRFEDFWERRAEKAAA